jgi:ribonuclease P protein component
MPVAPAPFPRAARLLKAKDFSHLRTAGRRIGTQHLSAQIAANTVDGARLGLAISKRVSKSAVRRNRIKRLARDSFRRMRGTLPPFDILLIARSSADQEDNASLRAELARLWQRIATLNPALPTGTMRD